MDTTDNDQEPFLKKRFSTLGLATMIKHILTGGIVYFLIAPVGFSLTLQSRHHEICGVESYNVRRDPICGVELYKEARSEVCGVEKYNSKADMRCPGSRPVVISDPGRFLIGVDADGKPTMPDLGGPNVCELPEFGVALWKACRSPQNEVESYHACQNIAFGIAKNKECRFYKTPEEIDAFIESTYSQLALNMSLLPDKKSDIYRSLRHEASFICMIDKYQSLGGFEDVYNDLSTKFKNSFGYDYKDSAVSCVDAEREDQNQLITAGKLKCSDFTLDKLRSLAAPDDTDLQVFACFKARCLSKLAYDELISWFEKTSQDIDLLLADIVARQDPERRARLEELKSSILSNL